jgi:hydrolase, TatD family
MLFDSHAHYDDAKFAGEQDKLLEGMSAEGVSKIVNIGASLSSSEASVKLSEKYKFVYATAGIHPSDAVADMKYKDWLEKLSGLLAHKKTVAIGEIGLDYHYGAEEKEAQKECFLAQMELAKRKGMRVVIHDREAHGDCMEIIRAFPTVTGVMHSYSGSLEMAKELMAHGYYISINGIITFDKTKRLCEILKKLKDLHPDASHRLLIETDCPYLAPVPFRGKTNHSGLLKYTAQAAAQMMEMEYEEFCTLTYRNACTFYSIGETV